MNSLSRWYCLVTLFLSLLLAVPGCASWNYFRGGGFTDEDAQWGESLRQPEPAGQGFGFSEKAKQIERNVGYQ